MPRQKLNKAVNNEKELVQREGINKKPAANIANMSKKAPGKEVQPTNTQTTSDQVNQAVVNVGKKPARNKISGNEKTQNKRQKKGKGSKENKEKTPENKVSEYFSSPADQNDHDSQSKGETTKLKSAASNKTSFASKLKGLSDAEFEEATVNYRSPVDKKKPVAKKIRDKLEGAKMKETEKDGNFFTGKEDSTDRKRKHDHLKGMDDDKNSKTKAKKAKNIGKGKPAIEKKKGKSKTSRECKQSKSVNKKEKNTVEKISTCIDSVAEANYSEDNDEEMMEVEENIVEETDLSVECEAIKSIPKSVDYTDAMAVLMHIEGPKQSDVPVFPSTSTLAAGGDVEPMSGDHDDSDVTDDESDWEDVEDHHGNSPKKSQLPSGPVEITLDAPVIYKKRKKGEFDLQAYFKRQINKFKREVAMDIHKVHLMCLLARCQYLNQLCQEETVRAQALSLTLSTRELKLPASKSCTENHVVHVLNWIREKKHYLNEVMAESLMDLSSQIRLALICVVLLRQVGFLTRLMTSLQPVPFKESSNKKGKSQKNAARISNAKSNKKVNLTSATSKLETKKAVKTNLAKVKKEKVTEIKVDPDAVKLEGENCHGKELKGKKSTVKRRSSDRKCSKVLKNTYKETVNSDDEMMSAGDDDDFIPDDFNDYDDDDCKVSGSKKGKNKEIKTIRKGKTKIKTEVKDENVSDNDFEENDILLRTLQLKKNSPSPKNKKLISSDNESTDFSGVDNWAEVYIQREQKWICVDCVAVQVKKPYEIENKASQPICYVVGISQDGHVRDVTARYASQWLTETRKIRTDTDWWQETLEPYKCPDSEQNKLEDAALTAGLHQRPLPTTVGAFKNHPLYALRRHLLKFEAIYPNTAIPVGYMKGEPVYARECVHTLHSRENWLKEGRAVRIGEEPYKFVKSRAKWNRPKEDSEAKDLELFGYWQTEVYIPPPAVDGKVPRNAHGNVEMFLPSMLPAGTVHLKVPGLNKVAKKLDIDCAPAMVGWEQHCGFSHPLMDGWIVCEEHKDILLAAWDEEQEIIKEKEQQKREKRVYDNWRKLIRGMLIKERLKKRFDLEEKPSEVANKAVQSSESHSSKKIEAQSDIQVPMVIEKADDKKYAWPQNRINDGQFTLTNVEKL